MPNISGNTYGLTILCPIKSWLTHNPAPEQLLREYIDSMPNGSASPFTRVQSTHFARLSIIDNVVFEGATAREDHLRSQYLWFNSNFDGDLESYLDDMFLQMPTEIEEIWKHCVAFPGLEKGRDEWKRYMIRCQIKTTFFFAAVNDMTVEEMLRALMLQREFSSFAARNQGVPAAELQQNFKAFMAAYREAPTPAPGTIDYKFSRQGE